MEGYLTDNNADHQIPLPQNHAHQRISDGNSDVGMDWLGGRVTSNRVREDRRSPWSTSSR
eukprot:CAMPEP_0178653168 /NCGR_PEP_ID=MMETSP0698-20121128/23027_1 /TAXON_ID=265572 /ORGANISM="Extubocellulus spinifer, Strain CCMP396" /LENGTH=59 /DNA_ID=CAMNT_0020294899 /DNA_START=174 /DNA_END=350 /DNA_ORIENTATION=+